MTRHYHGTPITPRVVLSELGGCDFCISFANPQDVEWCHLNGQGNMLDNGEYTAWTKGIVIDRNAYYAWCEKWLAYKTTWAVIPDPITGTVEENDALISQWPHGQRGAPVWHMHEPIDRLKRLCDEWERVCIGSSAEYRTVGAPNWHHRMSEAMNAICKTGRVPSWLHMLRGMAAAQWGYPFTSVDSTDVARNHNRKNNAREMADRWNSIQCSPFWKRIYLQADLLEAA